MNNQIIYFTCALFAMVAITAVTAQDNSTILDNSTMNNVSLLNNTTLNASMNETAPASNETASENVLLATEPVSVSSQSSAPLAIGSIQMGSSQNSVFAVSRLASSPATFSIENQPLHKEAYEVGLPAETIMDLSALPFYVNKI